MSEYGEKADFPSSRLLMRIFAFGNNLQPRGCIKTVLCTLYTTEYHYYRPAEGREETTPHPGTQTKGPNPIQLPLR